MFPKPSRARAELNRYAARQKREREKRRQKLIAQRHAADAWAKVRAEVFARDGGRCRAYGNRIYLSTGCLPDLMHAHHIVYRSAGGDSSLSNLLALSAEAHAQVHDGLLDIQGDGNQQVTFTKRDLKGHVTHVWTSAPVNAVQEA